MRNDWINVILFDNLTNCPRKEQKSARQQQTNKLQLIHTLVVHLLLINTKTFISIT